MVTLVQGYVGLGFPIEAGSGWFLPSSVLMQSPVISQDYNQERLLAFTM
jgi:hypothetical protein